MGKCQPSIVRLEVEELTGSSRRHHGAEVYPHVVNAKAERMQSAVALEGATTDGSRPCGRWPVLDLGESHVEVRVRLGVLCSRKMRLGEGGEGGECGAKRKGGRTSTKRRGPPRPRTFIRHRISVGAPQNEQREIRGQVRRLRPADPSRGAQAFPRFRRVRSR